MTAPVSLMITAAQKVELRARGYSDNDIFNLTPTAAHAILGIGAAAAASNTPCFTVVQSSDPPQVGKTYRLDKNKRLTKTSVASIVAGAATTIQATPDNLVEALKRAAESDNTVIALDAYKGASPGDPAEIHVVTEHALERLTGGPIGAVHPGFFNVKGKLFAARLRRLMEGSGWILLDADTPEGMPPEWARLSLVERLELLEAILPGISRCLRIEYRGSSARVINGGPEPGPSHALIRVSDPSRLDHMRMRVHIESVRKGLAFRSPRYSRKDGKVVSYAWLTVFDWSVWGAGRLIFAARPDVSAAPGYRVLDANVQVVNPQGGPLDIDGIEPPTEEELADYAAKTGLSVSIDTAEKDRFTIREDGRLRLDTAIESRGVIRTLAEWLTHMFDHDIGKMRCESPFRASISEAAFIRIGPGGRIFVHDIGTMTKHVLEPLPQTIEDARARAPTAGAFEAMKMVIEARTRARQRQAEEAFGAVDEGEGPPEQPNEPAEPAEPPVAPQTWDNAPEFSDEDLALRFASQHASNLRYVAAMGRWFIWNGKVWLADEKRDAFSLSRQVVRATARECRKKSLAKSLASAKTVAAVERLAQADPRLAAVVDMWDADPWLLNTPDGIIDLRTGDLKPHSSGAYMTKMTAVGPAGACPRFEKFMDEVMAGDQEMVSFIQRVLGYCLTGDTSEEVIFFFYGTGQNGKGVLMSTLEWILGEYCKAAGDEVFTETKNDRHSTEIARLNGARVVLVTEVGQGKHWAEVRLKKMTGGDTLTARFMRQDDFEFKPQFKPLVSANHKPQLRSVDYAMRRRMNLIPFAVTIPPEKRDNELKEKLKAEGPGILQWLIIGCLEYQMFGLSPPQSVIDATDEYFQNEDGVANWIDECCETGNPNLKDFSAKLFCSWKDYAERSRLFIGDARKFKEEMGRLGYSSKHTENGTMFAGLRLRTSAEQDEKAPF
jgi:putative DNA primase/helicase